MADIDAEFALFENEIAELETTAGEVRKAPPRPARALGRAGEWRGVLVTEACRGSKNEFWGRTYTGWHCTFRVSRRRAPGMPPWAPGIPPGMPPPARPPPPKRSPPTRPRLLVAQSGPPSCDTLWALLVWADARRLACTLRACASFTVPHAHTAAPDSAPCMRTCLLAGGVGGGGAAAGLVKGEAAAAPSAGTKRARVEYASVACYCSAYAHTTYTTSLYLHYLALLTITCFTYFTYNNVLSSHYLGLDLPYTLCTTRSFLGYTLFTWTWPYVHSLAVHVPCLHSGRALPCRARALLTLSLYFFTYSTTRLHASSVTVCVQSSLVHSHTQTEVRG
jgi:hypothetical protein